MNWQGPIAGVKSTAHDAFFLAVKSFHQTFWSVFLLQCDRGTRWIYCIKLIEKQLPYSYFLFTAIYHRKRRNAALCFFVQNGVEWKAFFQTTIPITCKYHCCATSPFQTPWYVAHSVLLQYHCRLPDEGGGVTLLSARNFRGKLHGCMCRPY